VWGQTKLWVGLVLDNTGSMCQSDTNPSANAPCNPPASGTKIASLISATHNLLSMLQSAAAHPGDIKVAIVPFVKDVNVGTGNAGATWIDWTSWDAANGTCDISSIHSQSTCTSTHGTWSPNQSAGGTCTISSQTSQSNCTSAHGTWTAASCNISGINSQSTCTSTHGTWSFSSCNIPGYTTRTTCQNAVGTWTPASCNIAGINTQTTCTSTVGQWTWNQYLCNLSAYTTQSTCTAATAVWHVDHTQWTGCVTDRGNSSGPDTSNNYDAMNTAPSSTTASKFLAEQYSNCPTALLPLTANWTDLSNEVDAMVAGGGTNQTIGLVWGWHALTNSDPLNPGSVPANTTRYIIILSDGLNTQDRWYGNGVNQSTQVDGRMNAVCTNAKADGIIVYALFVDIGGTQGNSTVLQNCASDSSKYWDLTSASQINAAFAAIGQQITNLRVAL